MPLSLFTLHDVLCRFPQMPVAPRYLILVIALLSAGAAQAAEIYIDGVACQLPDAIRAANTDQAVFGCSAGAGADTLILTRDVKLQLGDLPSITSDITIEFADLAAQVCDTDDAEKPPDDPNDPPTNDDPPDDPEDPPSNDDPPDDPEDPPINDDPPDDPDDPPINDDPPQIPPDDTSVDPSPSPTKTTGDPAETPTNTATSPPPPTATSSPTPNGAATFTPTATSSPTPDRTATALATVSGTPDLTKTATVAATEAPSTNIVPGIPNYCLHVVAYGENLYRIALKYELTVREISSFNQLLSDDRLDEDQILLIPHKDCHQYAALKG